MINLSKMSILKVRRGVEKNQTIVGVYRDFVFGGSKETIVVEEICIRPRDFTSSPFLFFFFSFFFLFFFFK